MPAEPSKRRIMERLRGIFMIGPAKMLGARAPVINLVPAEIIVVWRRQTYILAGQRKLAWLGDIMGVGYIIAVRCSREGQGSNQAVPA